MKHFLATNNSVLESKFSYSEKKSEFSWELTINKNIVTTYSVKTTNLSDNFSKVILESMYENVKVLYKEMPFTLGQAPANLRELLVQQILLLKNYNFRQLPN